jgi:hypothetical protein
MVMADGKGFACDRQHGTRQTLSHAVAPTSQSLVEEPLPRGITACRVRPEPSHASGDSPAETVTCKDSSTACCDAKIATKLADRDLARIQRAATMVRAAQEAMQEATANLAAVEGAYRFSVLEINDYYALTAADRIEEDGTIVRGQVPSPDAVYRAVRSHASGEGKGV